MLSNGNRYSKLLRLSNLISEHEKATGISREDCRGCNICKSIDILEEELGTVADTKATLTDNIRLKLKDLIADGKSDAFIVKELNVSYNTVKTFRQIVRKEKNNDRK